MSELSLRQVHVFIIGFVASYALTWALMAVLSLVLAWWIAALAALAAVLYVGTRPAVVEAQIELSSVTVALQHSAVNATKSLWAKARARIAN